MLNDLNGSPKLIAQEGAKIHDSLSEDAASQPPQTLIREFKNLFIQGRSKNPKLSKSLDKIIFSPLGQKQFDRFFSNCFYSILNCWVEQPESLTHIEELLAIVENIGQHSSYDRRRKQLIELIKDYQKSQPYLQLKAIITIINSQEISRMEISLKGETNETAENSQGNHIIVNNCLPRYTYLYENYGIKNEEFEQLNKFIQSLQNKRRQDFEIKLSRHIIYRFRLKQVAKLKLLSKGAGKVITKVNNPSLLSERAFQVALKQYLGVVDNKQTILERSQRFTADNKLRSSYLVFKQDLLQFLTQNIKPRNNTYQFKQKLERKLQTIFVQSDSRPVNPTLILQTCRQLFSFLVIDTNTNNNSLELNSLIANLGTAQVMIILIKIILICPESKADLEKKLSIIVSQYQLNSIKDTPWLVKTLEHLLIAFGIYFGKIDVSIAKSVINK